MKRTQSNYIKIAPKIPQRTLLEHHVARGLTFMEIVRLFQLEAAQLKAAAAFYEISIPPSPQRSEARRVQLRQAGYSWEQIAILSPETLKVIHRIGKIQVVKFSSAHRLELRRLVANRTILNVAWNKANAKFLAEYKVTTSLISRYGDKGAAPSHRNLGEESCDDL